MTVLIGVLCNDGVVIGSDSSATFSAGPVRTVEQPAMKTFVIAGDVLVAGTGQVGLCQRFCHITEQVRRSGDFLANHRNNIAKAICSSVIQDFSETQAPKGEFGAMVAFPSDAGVELCEFAANDLQPEFKTSDCWFVSMGSGQLIADPFLGLLRRVFFDGAQPQVSEGIFATLWALQHAFELNTGGIQGPPQIGVLRRNSAMQWQARLLDDDELQEHANNIDQAERHLGDYRRIMSGAINNELQPPTSQPPEPPS